MAQFTDEELAQLKARLQRRYLELREEVRGELERSGNQRYIDITGSVADPGRMDGRQLRSGAAGIPGDARDA